MDHSNSANQDRPRYASLTAGLLARKGQAVPVAASFSPEAMAQHLPAKRLAQEFEIENGESLRHMQEQPSLNLEASNDPTAGPIEQRTSLIEDAFIQGAERKEPHFENNLDLFGDEVVEEKEPSGSLGLDKLVDRAIESAQRKRQEETGEMAPAAEKPQMPPELANSSCAAAKADLVTSIRNAAVSDSVSGAGITLDPRRYIRLQVAAMKLDVSKQELVSAALDSFLDTLLEDVFAECACMQKGLI